SSKFVIDFYASPLQVSPFGQANRYLGSTTVTTDANGNAPINVTLPVATSLQEVITATATDQTGTAPDLDGNTSDLSAPIAVVLAPPSSVSPLARTRSKTPTVSHPPVNQSLGAVVTAGIPKSFAPAGS